MNITIKEPLIFLGGAAVGFLISRIFLKKKYERITDQEIENAKAFYSQLVINEYTSEEPIEKEKNEEDKQKKPLYSSSEDRYIDYTQFYNKKGVDPAEEEHPSEDDDQEDEDYRAGEKLTEMSNLKKGIDYISVESFEEDYLNFPKETLFYYVKDKTLVDENEEIIDNPEAVIGDAIESLGMDYSDGANVGWIRNFNLGSDYEIRKVEGSFR